MRATNPSNPGGGGGRRGGPDPRRRPPWPRRRPAPAAASQYVTWTCTSTPCPWGPSTAGDAFAWPAELGPVSDRLGYTTSAPIYLPAAQANGLTVTVTSGYASLCAGAPGADGHRNVTGLGAGELTIAGIGADEVISIQSWGSFELTYEVAVTPEPPAPGESQFVTWTCSSAPCPWGTTTAGEAFAWPG